MITDAHEALQIDLKAVMEANNGADVSAWAGRATYESDAIGLKILAGTHTRVLGLEGEVVDELRIIRAEQAQAWAKDVTGTGLDWQVMADYAQEVVAKYADDM